MEHRPGNWSRDRYDTQFKQVYPVHLTVTQNLIDRPYNWYTVVSLESYMLRFPASITVLQLYIKGNG